MSSTDNILPQIANLEKKLETILENWEAQSKAGKKPDNASKQAHSHQDKGVPSSERKRTGEQPCKNCGQIHPKVIAVLTTVVFFPPSFQGTGRRVNPSNPLVPYNQMGNLHTPFSSGNSLSDLTQSVTLEPVRPPSTPTTELEDERKGDPNPTMSFPAGSLRELVKTMRRKTNPLKEGISITTKPVYMGRSLEHWNDQAKDNWVEEEHGNDKSIT
ncbi:hypothetical protein FRC11_011180 [Ceratobasidium sp. 423]|nr:hypothetical protein FRC11_011180 [Ceratobasidium sp. 423]